MHSFIHSYTVLTTSFRATAPFLSAAGPGVLPFFEGCGPYKRWLPPSEVVSKEQMRAGTSSDTLTREVEEVVRSAVDRVRSAGGRVIGLLGFSQGTKVVAGLLRASELRKEVGMVDEDWCDFKMAICVCSSYPPPLMPPSIVDKLPAGTNLWEKKISTPVFLAQGKQDEWLWAGQLIIGKYYNLGKGKADFNEFNMGHHYPVVASDNEKIAAWLVDTAKKVEAVPDVDIY
jgi:hypothetical protein